MKTMNKNTFANIIALWVVIEIAAIVHALNFL